MTLTRQSTLLAWFAALTVAAVLATTLLAMREVREQTRQSEWAEATAQGANQFRYLIMETALFHEPRAGAQWRTRLASFQAALGRQQYGSARENALLARERENLAMLARQYQRLADPDINAQMAAATVSNLFLTSQDMIDDAAELIRQNRLDLRRAQQRADRIVLSGVALLAGLIAACCLVMRRRVLAPVAALQTITERVADGDLSLRLRLSEDNEIGQLAATFDRMTAQLEESLGRMQLEIGERQHAQDALEHTVAQLAARSAELASTRGDLQNIIDHTPALVVYWDHELKNRFANRAYQDWFGLAPEVIHGMHVRDVVGPERYADIEPMLAAVVGGQREVFERSIRMPDGSVRDMLFSYTPDMRDGRFQGFYGFISDISQLKLAQSGQAEALARLQGIVDAAIDFGIIATSLDGTIELFSRGAERLLGYRAAEVVRHAGLARFHKADEIDAAARMLSNQYGRAVAGFEVFVQGARHGQSETREWTCVRRDGYEVEVSLTVTALRDAAGEPIGYLAVATDISRDQAILRTLAAARDQAEEGSRAKSEFLANVSHEIRTPMNAILGLLQMLQQTDLTERQRGYAGSTQAAARSLLRLLNDILDFSKVDAGKLVLEQAPFSLQALAAELRALAEPLAAGKSLALRFACAAALPASVVGDPLRLRQVLLNLIGNAIKFTEAGEVQVEVAAGPDGRIEFAVQDTGIGIAPDQLDRIFDAFSQAETSTARRFGGTGLGLAISQRLVQLMGGTLDVSSVQGTGSRFSFALPLRGPAPVPAPALPADTVPAAPPLLGKRLLVVDDNELNREVAQALLGIQGAEVLLADGGEAALQLLRAPDSRIDLVLMDVQMPGMDGHAATRAIRSMSGPEAHLARLPVVAMTANAMAGDREACLAAGMDDYVEKPIDIEVLVNAVLGQLGRHGQAADKGASAPAASVSAGAQLALQRLGGSVALFLSLARRYPDDARAQAAALDAALAAHDAPGAARQCHSLRGVAGTVGADALTAFLATLEAGLKRDPQALAMAHERAQLARLVEDSFTALAQACAVLQAGRAILVS